MPGLTIAKSDPSADGETKLVVGGELDLTTAHELHDALIEALEARPPGVAVDLSAVELLDTIGLSRLLEAHQRADQLGIQLTWVDPAPAVSRMFDLTGAIQLLNVRTSD